MLDQILQQIRTQLADVLQSHPDLDPTQAQQAANAATDAFTEHVKAQVNQNDYSTLNEALSGNETAATHPAIQQQIEPVANRIASQTGMDKSKALSVAAMALPALFNMFNSHVQQARGNGIDVLSLIRQFASGGFNLGSLGLLMSGAKGNQTNSGGIGGMLSGLFK